MAIATSTALAIGGMAISAGSAGASFAQAGKQRKLQKQAEADADRALQEARKRTEVNVYKGLNINKDAYEMQSEALLSQGAQAVEALREGDVRGLAGGLGRVYQAQAQAQDQNRIAYGQDISSIQKQVADEETKLRNINLQLDLGEISGAQQAAADAANKAAAANKAGFQQLTSAAKQGLEGFVPLFSQNTSAAPINASALQVGAPQIGTPAQQSLAPAYMPSIATTPMLPPQVFGLMPQTTPVGTGGLYQGQINTPYNPFQISLPKYP